MWTRPWPSHASLASIWRFGDEGVRDATALAQLGDDVCVGFGATAVAALAARRCRCRAQRAFGRGGHARLYDTLKAGRTLALANRSLVVGGDLIMPLAARRTLLPVDSEHSAIYQCYLGEFSDEARRIWLTCSVVRFAA